MVKRKYWLVVAFVCLLSGQSQPPPSDNSDKRSSPDWWAAGFTGVIAFAAVVQVGVYLRQTRVMTRALGETRIASGAARDSARAAAANASTSEKTLEAIQAQLTLAERSVDVARQSADAALKNAEALINSECARINVGPRGINLQTPSKGLNAFLCALENYGRTVAKITGPWKTNALFLPFGDKLPTVPVYRDAFPAMSVDEAVILWPSKPIERGIPILDMTDDIFAAVLERTLILYVYASITYFDFADREWELVFCYTYLPRVEGSPQHWVAHYQQGYNRCICKGQ